jgi:hypothetical protein
MKCSKCYADLTEEDIFCPECGKKIEKKKEKTSSSKKWLIIVPVIAILLLGGGVLAYLFIPRCGDGKITAGEDCSTCQKDVKCGSYETCQNGQCVTFCGNGKCDVNENKCTCPQDCGSCSGSAGTCQEFYCNGNECDIRNITNCCGNQKCEINESCSGCPSDCGICINLCHNGAKDPDESDIDCGGSCSDCSTGKKCIKYDDCITQFCSGNVCAVNICKDGIKSIGETDVDCGGTKCMPCVQYQQCNIDSDCASGLYCWEHIKCMKATSNDFIILNDKNGYNQVMVLQNSTNIGENYTAIKFNDNISALVDFLKSKGTQIVVVNSEDFGLGQELKKLGGFSTFVTWK